MRGFAQCVLPQFKHLGAQFLECLAGETRTNLGEPVVFPLINVVGLVPAPAASTASKTRACRAVDLGTPTPLGGGPLSSGGVCGMPDKTRAGESLRVAMVAPPWFSIPPQAYGGIEAVVADLVDALSARGHQVTLVGVGRDRTPGRF